MKLSLDAAKTANLITALTENSVTIGQRRYENGLIITPESIFEGWQPATTNRLTLQDFTCLEGVELEVILLGTGTVQVFPPPMLAAEFAQRGIGLEVMNTAAACRTFNILLSEDRRVAAALMLS
jgi:uncharacterized protein